MTETTKPPQMAATAPVEAVAVLEPVQGLPEGFGKPAPRAPPPPWDPSPDQAKAFDQVMTWVKNPNGKDTFCLGGLGGTGKSYLTGRIALELEGMGLNVVFCAPTGKATQVLRKYLNAAMGGEDLFDVNTIHGTIYRPEEDKATGRILGWKRRTFLDADLIVIDEASMVAATELENLRKLGKPILAVGDHGQLSPVGEDAGLMKKPDARLEKIHRQAKGNPIIRLSHIIRNGAPDEAVKAFIEDTNDARLQWTRSWDHAIDWGKPPGFVLTFTNRMRRTLNLKIREQIFGLDEYDDPKDGETVICLKNRRLDDIKYLPNGMRGVIKTVKNVSANHVVADVEFDDPVGTIEDFWMCKHQFLREATFKGFDEIPGEPRDWYTTGALLDLGYALTCHKSQGSQAQNVAVFVERSLAVLDEDERKRWLYTACSRASERLILVF